ncbi:hypothetical protein LCGC14_1894180, partial [marine sediment metagenome]
TGGSVGGTVYINEGTSSSADFNAIGGGGSGTTGTMNQVYEAGRLVQVDSGTIVYTDATSGALDIMRFTKSGAGSGDSLEFLHTAAATGRVIHMDMNLAIARTGMYIDHGGNSAARTGTDIDVKADGTGANIVLAIAASHSGATTGLSYTGSYAGSPAGSVVLATFDNSDNLDTGVLKVVRGTGVRTAPVVDINDASTGSADIFDIDLTGVYTGDVFDFASSAAATGNVFFLNLDNALAMTAIRMEGSGTRTQPFIELATDCVGSANMATFAISGAFTGDVLGFEMSATGSGSVIDITYSAINTGDAIKITTADAVSAGALVVVGAGARDDNLVDIVTSETGSIDGIVLIQTTGVFTGHVNSSLRCSFYNWWTSSLRP